MALQLDYESLMAKKKEIEELSGKYEASYKNLYAKVEELLKSYETADSKSFKTRLDSYQTQFADMKTLLDEYAAEMETIKAGFESVEQQLATEAGNIAY